METKQKKILISGGFDPIHKGHIDLIKAAAALGDVVVLLNSDAWLIQKKGKPFIDWEERCAIVSNMKGVTDVIAFDDSDSTAVDGIKKAAEKYGVDSIAFANGGDRILENVKDQQTTAEMQYCKEKGIEMRWNVGGGKSQSSSDLLARWNKK